MGGLSLRHQAVMRSTTERASARAHSLVDRARQVGLVGSARALFERQVGRAAAGLDAYHSQLTGRSLRGGRDGHGGGRGGARERRQRDVVYALPPVGRLDALEALAQAMQGARTIETKGAGGGVGSAGEGRHTRGGEGLREAPVGGQPSRRP